MAGSLNHLVDDDGSFRFDSIENLGDAYEACEECFDIIALLVQDNPGKLEEVCNQLGYPVPKAVPVVGKRSKYNGEYDE